MEGINVENVIHVKANLENNTIVIHCVDGSYITINFTSKELTKKAFNLIADKLIPNFVIVKQE